MPKHKETAFFSYYNGYVSEAAKKDFKKFLAE